MSALLTSANPHRIKASHRRRRSLASGRFVQRYYDAEIGRFISPDPVGPEEDFVNHFNRYNYAQNNPVRYTDPDGMSAVYFKNTNTLVIPTRFVGPGATETNIRAVQQKASELSGMNVVVLRVIEANFTGVNTLNLVDYKDFVNFPNGQGEGAILYSDFAQIDFTDREWVGAAVHDLLHLAGFEDYYDKNTFKPLEGHEPDEIMVSRTGTRVTNIDKTDMRTSDETKIGSSGGGSNTRRVHHGATMQRHIDRRKSK